MRWRTKDHNAAFLAKREWHRWFAWLPVTTAYPERIWLETVERRLVDGGAYHDWWEYRALTKAAS